MHWLRQIRLSPKSPWRQCTSIQNTETVWERKQLHKKYNKETEDRHGISDYIILSKIMIIDVEKRRAFVAQVLHVVEVTDSCL